MCWTEQEATMALQHGIGCQQPVKITITLACGHGIARQLPHADCEGLTGWDLARRLNTEALKQRGVLVWQ